ncbi:hypothetical protein PV325_008183 [Microctonus aethiopoides]|nr:hypothetical protein PV325_008183 [Microctonus aethiopoides]
MDSDSNSNQSQEMFSDDELITETYRDDFLKSDVSFVNSSQLSRSNSSSPMKQETYRCAEIPKTPLSLEPFISKAQVWTKDLETPEVKRPIRHRYFSTKKIATQSNSQIFDEQSTVNNEASTSYFNNLSVDEIVPTSQVISVRREKRPLSGPVQKIISNEYINPSEVDKQLEVQDRLGVIEETNSNKFLNNTIELNSNINFVPERNRFNNSSVNLNSEQVNKFNAAALAKRVMQLKKMQEERRKNINNYKSFSNEEFTKSLTSLACAQKFNSSDKTSVQTSINNPLGFVPFSKISMKLDDKNFQDEKSTKNTQDKNFHGFTREIQDNANTYAINYHNFLCKQDTQVLHDSPKSRDNFYGFAIDEIEQSHYIARRCKFLCDKYIDDNYQISNRSTIKVDYSHNKNISCLMPLSFSVNTGIKTASGNEIFIDIDIIYKSKKLLLDVENNLSEHNIDELIQNNSTHLDNSKDKTISPDCMINSEDEHVISNDTKNINEHTQIEKTLDIKLPQPIKNEERNEIINQSETDSGTCKQTSVTASVQENTEFNKENEEFNINSNKQTDIFAKSKSILINDEPKRYNKFKTIHRIGVKIPNDQILATKTLFEDKTDIKVDFPLMGFQTGHGKSIHISKDALLKAKTTFAQDMNDEISDVEMFAPCHNKENSIQTLNTIQNSTVYKRKYPTDDETPVGRKKIRIGSDLQRRKLFYENEERDNYSTESILHLNNKDNMETDRNIKFSPLQIEKLPNNITITANPSNNANVISNEVRESIAALLKDEENCNDPLDQWSTSPADVILLKNRRSDGLKLQKSDKNFEKRSRSYPGIGVEIGNKNTNLFYNKSSLNQKLSAKPPSPKHEDIPEDLYFDSPYSEEFIDTHMIEQNKQKRIAAIMKQKAHIEMKKTRKISQVIKGTLLHMKEINDGISLKNIFKNGKLVTRTPKELINAGIDPSILSINSTTAVDYKFRCADYYGQNFVNHHCDGIPIGDNATLIPNDDNLAGVNEFKQCFLASPGVDPTLVPSGYVENHYRWIVWKLASMDRSKTNEHMTIKFLTPDRVMKQLKYRYDREIDRSQRSALRRILEKDDAPSRRLVLCVSQIFTENIDDRSPISKCQPSTIELTDGWYSVRCSIDYAMLDNIKKDKIKVGTKLMIYGAELLNHNEGCYPLNLPSNVRLKIHTNSTRRVKWYIKLGYQRQSGPMVSNLKSINPNGGLIGKLIVAVARIYPIIYREKIGDGQFVDRNARCEEKVVIAYETECQSRIEALYAKTADECKGEKWKKDFEGRMMNYIPRQRDVIPITKIKVADGDYAALITLWSSGEESQSVFNENTYITIYNSLASGKKLNELQITTNRYTIFNNLPITSLKNTRIICSKRVFTSLDNTYSPGFNPYYGEFDTVGIVVSIGPAPHGMKNFETVNLAFKNDGDKHTPSFYLSILFWQGVSSYGLSEIATVGSFIACINLEWRKNTYKSIPTAFCTERTILTRNPKQSHLYQPFRNLCGIIKDPTQYVVTCALEIQNEIMKKSRSSLGSIGYNSFQSESKGLTEQDKTQNNSNIFINNRKLITPHSEPRNSLRSIATKARIDKLLNYGSAPMLSPIHLAQTSKIAQNYRSPVDRPFTKPPLPHSK